MGPHPELSKRLAPGIIDAEESGYEFSISPGVMLNAAAERIHAQVLRCGAIHENVPICLRSGSNDDQDLYWQLTGDTRDRATINLPIVAELLSTGGRIQLTV